MDEQEVLDDDTIQSTDGTIEYPHWFRCPTSISEAQYRITELKRTKTDISGQLADITRQDTMQTRDYLTWRKKAKKALAFAAHEARLLGVWIYQENQRRAAERPD